MHLAGAAVGIGVSCISTMMLRSLSLVLFFETCSSFHVNHHQHAPTQSNWIPSFSSVATVQETCTESSLPTEQENELFDCDDSVYFWRDFQRQGFESAESNLKSIAEVGSRFGKTAEGLDFWLRHVARSGYFTINAALGVVGSRLNQFLDQTQPNQENAFIKNLNGAVTSRLILEAALSYEQDYERIKQGLYPKPWDMYYNARQSSPLNLAIQTTNFLREATATLKRRNRASDVDKRVTLTDNIKTNMYPDYYLNAFHYQTNGWMSSESAESYETSTETLFVGRQDAMQRTALPQLVDYSRRHQVKAGGKPIKVLEIACGTGRFMTFVRDALPLDTEYTAIDLSPYYLAKARENDASWRQSRQDRTQFRTPLKPANILQAKAEDLPFADESFDAVVCVYLFHELPRNVRALVAAEMARVVKPGGRVVLTDSIQVGDRPVLDRQIGGFKNMNEPYYEDYVNDAVFAHFTQCGLECQTKMVCSTTKSLAFAKPNH